MDNVVGVRVAINASRLLLTVVAAISIATAPVLGAEPGNPGSSDGSVSALAEPPDADAAKLQTAVYAANALGLYIDDVTGAYVVVVPADGSSTFDLQDVASLGLDVRVEARSITHAQIKGMIAILRGLPK